MTLREEVKPPMRQLSAPDRPVGKLWKWFSNPPVGGPAAIVLIRVMAGGVFLWEGVLKFVYHNQGGGRFA